MHSHFGSSRCSAMATRHCRLAFLCHAVILLVLHSTSVSAQPSYTALANNVPISASVAANSTVYFTFISSPVAYQQTALLSVAASTGFPSMYASLTDTVPSPSLFTWAASYLTGGVVTILTQPPWTAYIAVVASPLSSSNFTVVASAYDPAVVQSSLLPLADGEPQASAIAAGEYRYFLYSLSTNTTALSIANTGAFGGTTIIVNGPNTTALPTLTACQWSSAGSNLQLVSVVNAVVGAYTIGVWSNSSAVFSLIASAATSVQPMQLGVVYPAVVTANAYRYYSVFIDALLIPTSGQLTLALYSWSGSAQLFCSNTTATPGQSNSHWMSTWWSPAQTINIASSELWPGTLYCGVLGLSWSAYTFAVSYGGPTMLTAGLVTVTEVLTAAQSESQFAYSFQGNSSSTGAFITVSVVSIVGPGTTVWMMPYSLTPAPGYGQWASAFAAPVQGLQVPTSDVCGTAFVNAIPGSSPLLCQLNILVITQPPGAFQLTVSGAQSVVPLTSGQLMDGAASAAQSASYSFVVPDNLSNLTLVLFVTNQATDVTLKVGPAAYGAGGLGVSIWTVTQQPGDPLLVFQLDWTNPLLPRSNRPQGSYVMVVSTLQNATFTLQYTLTNASGYGGTISPLIDGVSQLGQLQPSQYSFFFFFNLPQQGWPYTVTITVTWISGFGTMMVGVGDGTQPGPLPGQSSIIASGSLVSINPDNVLACAPNGTVIASGLPCGYAVSLLANAGGPSQFSVTATTAKWVRSIYASDGGSQSQASQVSPLDADAWAVRSLYTGTSSISELMVILTLSAGTVTLYASNLTAIPNASNSQYSLQVESMNALTIPLVPGLSGAVYYLSVACTSTVACEYALSVALFVVGSLSTELMNGAAVAAAIPAGQIGWWYLDVSTFLSVGDLSVQVDPALGSPSVYATCSTGYGPTTKPNETLYTWSAAGPGLVLLEVTTLPANLTAAGCRQVVVGVRASGGSSAVFVVSMVTSGGQQDLTWLSSGFGLLTSAFPVSYFLYNLMDDDPTVVLVFTLGATPASCLSDLQLLVSPTVVFPSASTPGVTYTWLSTVLQLDTGVTDLSVVVTNLTQPPGSLRAGYYFLAVVSQSPSPCQFQVQAFNNRQRQLELGSTVDEEAQSTATAYFSYNLPSTSAASFGLDLQLIPATLLLYLGFNSSPRPGDPASYAAVRTFDTSRPARPAPVYVPPNACPTPVCAIVFLATSNVSGQVVAVTTATSELSTTLTVSNTFVALNGSEAYVGYQFSPPSGSQLLTVTVSSDLQVDVACSYQYVQPDRLYYDWISSSSAVWDAATNQTMLAFSWSSGLQVNPTTALAAPASTCYCTVLPSDTSTGFSITVDSVALPSPSTSSRLSDGALAAAVIVPTLVALAVLSAVVWRYGRRCALGMEDMKARKGEHPPPLSRGDYSVSGENAISMVDLSAKRGRVGDPMLNQQWYSDSS